MLRIVERLEKKTESYGTGIANGGFDGVTTEEQEFDEPRGYVA